MLKRIVAIASGIILTVSVSAQELINKVKTEKRMKAQTNVFGRIVKKYDMPLEAIDDLNIKYEEHRKF